MRILLALLSILAGLVLVFGGYRLARLAIPLLGFIAGLSIGGAVITDLESTPFLGTLLGIMIGVVLGLLFGAFAYFYYYAAVVVLGGSLGYWAGSSFVLLFGFSPGLLSAVVGIVVGIFLGIVTAVLNAPKYVLITLTALAGAVATVGGILLLFNQIPLDTYSYTTINVALSHSFIWTLITVVLWSVGISIQATITRGYEFDEWALTGSDHHHSPPAPKAHGPTA